MNNSIFIAWSGRVGSPRGPRLANLLGANYVSIEGLQKRASIIHYLLDYTLKSVRTFSTLMKSECDNIIIQSGPAPCVIIGLIYSVIRKKKMVVDAHNGAFSKKWFYFPLYSTALKFSETVIVHNYEFCQYLSGLYNDINFTLLSDPLLELNCSEDSSSFIFEKKKECFEKIILIPLTGSYDEPVEEIFKAISDVDSEGVIFKITGNVSAYKRFEKYVKKNIQLVGYLDSDEYYSIFSKSIFVISLTTVSKVQQSIVVESISYGKPVVTNDNVTNRNLVSNSAVFIPGNSYSDIRKGILDMLNQYKDISHTVSRDRLKYIEDWKENFKRIYDLIYY